MPIRKDNLEKARSAPRSKQEHNLIKKAKADPKSRTKAIHAMCFHCFGGTEEELPDSGYKRAIRECTASACPLYNFRPYK